MDEARSQRLTEMLHAVQAADCRTGDSASNDDLEAARQKAKDYYNELKRVCDEGHAVVIHTQTGVSKKEEIRTLGKLDSDMLVTTYSPNAGSSVCVTMLNLVEGDFVEVR